MRNLGSSISVVVGSVIFQNEMKSRQPQLIASLGAQTASSFGGGDANANVGLVKSLPADQRYIVRKAYADSLSTMWILYTAFAAVGILVSLLIGKNVLDKQHEETKTGLEEERKRRLEKEAERAERKRKKASKGMLPPETEAQAVPQNGMELEETKV